MASQKRNLITSECTASAPKTVYERIIPLQKLQGEWISSYGDVRVCVDLLCVYMRTEKCKPKLQKRGNHWNWSGWTLTELIEDDEGRSRTLRWEKKKENFITWTLVGESPKLEIRRLDINAPMCPAASKAMRILTRTFVVKPKIKSNPRVEIYGLEFSGSTEGVFASCLIIRDTVSAILYFATRPPLQALGFGQILLDGVMSYPTPTEESSVSDSDGSGEKKETNRWVAIVREKTRKAACDSTDWWNRRNFAKDSTDELDDYNPFDSCLVLEYVEPGEACKRRRVS